VETRTFIQGEGPNWKYVRVQVQGTRMVVTQGRMNGPSKRSEKQLQSEAEAASACALMARELFARGFLEQRPGAPKPAVAASRPKLQPTPEPPEGELALADAVEDAAPVITRSGRAALASRPAVSSQPGADGAPARVPKKKKKKKGKRAKEGENDRFVMAGIAAGAALVVGIIGYVIWAEFLRPASIVGTWQGSKIDYEIGKPIIYSHYKLILDQNHRSALTLQQSLTMVGTYEVKGNILKLNVGDSLDSSEMEYKFELGSVELTLYHPGEEKPMVKLIRLHKMEKVPPARKKKPHAVLPPAAAPGADMGDNDPGADEP
jgi:hypothetical protein